MLKPRGDIDLVYRLTEIADEGALSENEVFDMVIIRKPDIHNSLLSWEKVYEKAFHHLKQNGILLTTTEQYDGWIREQIEKRGAIGQSHTISESDRVSPFFNEDRLIIAQKRI